MNSTIQPVTFAGLELRSELVAAVTALGYEEPTPIQRETIPVLLSGRDVLGQAATGTGKTAAFALPLLHRIGADRPKAGAVRGLVLVPTRELAMQVAEAMHKYAKGLGMQVLPMYGGAPMHLQIRALERGTHVVVATPGRALDHLRRGTLRLDQLSVLVLDEADEMLDMGFAEDLDQILAATPDTKQTALFSATMPARILAIAQRHLTDPARITVGREAKSTSPMPKVRQVAYIVGRAHKRAALARVLDMEDPVATLVFCRTRLDVDTLVETMNAHGQRAAALHGGMAQRQRDTVLNQFRAKKVDLLIATDVAARGLDIEHLSHVVNYDVPASAEVYLHRIGRTGRAGRGGTAITLAEAREHRLLRVIEQFTKSKIEVATVPTVADIRSRQLDVTRAALRERLLARDFDHVRVVIDSLSEEFDIVDIASAAVLMLHAASAGADDEREIPVIDMNARPTARPRREVDGKTPRPAEARGEGRLIRAKTEREPGRGAASRNEPAGDFVRIFIGAGRRAGVRPGDLVGAITGESGIQSRSLGAIEIADQFSLVDVEESLADTVIEAMRSASIRGKRVQVRRDRGRF